MIDRAYRRKFNVKRIISDAKKYFNLTLHPEKVKIVKSQKEATFLGYQFNGMRLIRPTKEWFERLLYPEKHVKNLPMSASRMYAFYLLGGCNDPDFMLYYDSFVTCYNLGDVHFDPG